MFYFEPVNRFASIYDVLSLSTHARRKLHKVGLGADKSVSGVIRLMISAMLTDALFRTTMFAIVVAIKSGKYDC